MPEKTKKQLFQDDLKDLIEKYFGPIELMDPVDRDKFFKDIYWAFCDLMMRDWQINLYINRLSKTDLHLEKHDDKQTWQDKK